MILLFISSYYVYILKFPVDTQFLLAIDACLKEVYYARQDLTTCLIPVL